MLSQATAKEYWAKKGEIDLYVYRKYVGSLVGKPILFLVHGSSVSSRPGYDIQVPGRGSDYSMMDQCAHAGFDVWTMDHEGYGRSSRSHRNSDVAMAVDDIDKALDIIVRETGRDKMHVYGQSGGALRAALYAQLRPKHVGKLVLESVRNNKKPADWNAAPATARPARLDRAIWPNTPPSAASEASVSQPIQTSAGTKASV